MDEIEQAYQEGLARFNERAYDEALANFGRVPLTQNKLYPKSLAYIGRIQSLRGDYAAAEGNLQQSLTLQAKPGPQTLYFLGEVYFYQRRWDQAEDFLRRCVRLEPKFTDAHIRLGMVYKELGQLADATKSFEQAIANDQKAVVARYQLALICTDAGDYKRALGQLHMVKDLAANYAPAFVLQGDIFTRLGDHRQAIVEFVKVVEMGKADAAVFWRLGCGFLTIDDRRQAAKAFEEATRRDVRMWAAHLQAAELLEQLDELDRALAHYKALKDVEEHRAVAVSAIERLTKLRKIAGRTGASPAVDDSSPFEAPPVTTKVAATHTLEILQRQLSREIRPARTMPLKGSRTQAQAPQWDDAGDDVPAASSPLPAASARKPVYQGSDIVEQLSAALRSGTMSDVMSVLRSASMKEIGGSLRKRFENEIDPLLKLPGKVKLSKLPEDLRQTLAKALKKKS